MKCFLKQEILVELKEDSSSFIEDVYVIVFQNVSIDNFNIINPVARKLLCINRNEQKKINIRVTF